MSDHHHDMEEDPMGMEPDAPIHAIEESPPDDAADEPASATSQAQPYQAQQKTSPLGHVFFVTVILLLIGLIWHRVEQDWTLTLKAWVGVCTLVVVGVVAWKGVDLFVALQSRRGAAAGFVTVTLFFGTLVLVLVSAASVKFRPDLPSLDLTESRDHSLSEATERLLEEVKGTIHAAYLMQASGRPDFRGKAIQQLNLYERGSARVEVSVFDDYREKQSVTEWMRKYGVTSPASGETGDVIVLAYAEPGLEVAAGKFREIKVDPGTWQRTSSMGSNDWLGEQVISDAIQSLVFERQKAYSTGGHGERRFGEGFRRFRDRVRGLNIELIETPLALASSPKVPDDCDLLFVLDPQSPFLPAEAEAIQRFLDRGGRLFLTVNPYEGRRETGLERVLTRYGVYPQIGYRIMVPRLVPTASGITFAKTPLFQVTLTDYADHPATRGLRAGGGLGTVYLESALVKVEEEPAEGTDPQPVVFASHSPDLLRASGGQDHRVRPHAAFMEPGRQDYETFLPEKDIEGTRLPIVATSSRALIDPDEDASDSRVIVCGDTDMFTDGAMAQGGAANFDLGAGLIQWALRREGLVAVDRRSIEETLVRMTARKARAAFWYPLGVVLLPLVIGTWVWWTRRI